MFDAADGDTANVFISLAENILLLDTVDGTAGFNTTSNYPHQIEMCRKFQFKARLNSYIYSDSILYIIFHYRCFACHVKTQFPGLV